MEEGKATFMRDIGEKEFLSKIFQYVDTPLLEFNDDASAIELPSGEILVINVDMLVQGTDVLPGMAPFQIGMKAVTMAVSDIVAKGVKPVGCLASVGFSSKMNVVEAEEIIQGIKKQCTSYDCLFLGGDLNESKETIVDIVSFGTCSKTKLIPRKGAISGDLIYSTGLFGLTSLGFEMLLEGRKIETALQIKILEAVYEPSARNEFLAILQNLPIKICMDSSDGLLVTLNDLSTINDLGINITTLPLHPEIKEFAEKNELNPLDLTFKGGEEFELIFAVSPETKQILESKTKELGLIVYHLGIFDSNIKGMKITDPSYSNLKLPKNGYEHFKNK
ncbi:MAG: thiamine-phosphate kinase [Candidatus Heimdallarchaeota archaeon]|nr:thiamine-phosphate kinase [Candidatus Heimdallarchaeota archaeon]